MTEPEFPTVDEIYAIHEEIVAEYGLQHSGIKGYFPDKKLGRVIERAAVGDDIFHQAAVFLKRIPMIHVFEDGNKRTAWLIAYEFLDRNGHNVAPDEAEAEKVMKSRQRFSVSELARWLRSGEIDEEQLR